MTMWRRKEGYEAWALWNSCQGVFTNAVFHRKSEAEEAMKGCNGVYEKVVPVRVYVEPQPRWWWRDEQELQKEKYR